MKSFPVFFISLIIFLFYNILFLLSQNPYDGITIDFTPLSIEEEKIFYEEYNPVIIPQYFVLGILKGQSTIRYENRVDEGPVDWYEYSEEPLMNFIQNYIKKYLGIEVMCEKKEDRINMHSIELAKMMNRYFDKEGVLKMELFESKEKINSFLLGSYYRFGYKSSENVYSIRRHYNNSMYLLLKEAECNRILFLSTKYAIPGAIVFYFEPPVRLRKYFSTIEKEKSELNQFQFGKKWPKNDENERMIEQIFNYFGDNIESF